MAGLFKGVHVVSINLVIENNVAILTIDRPEALNALSFALIEDVGRKLAEVAASGARALIIVGAGTKAFCAGADVKELIGRTLSEEKCATRRGQNVFAQLDGLLIPSIALVNGYALGGGSELALACTFRLATPSAKFALPEIKLGLIPGYGGTQRLPRLIGEARATEIILSGRTVGAQEALSIGLVNRIVESPYMMSALSFAAEFTGYSLTASQFARQAIRRGLATTISEGLEIEADLSTLAYRTGDAQEGLQAFLDKRPPRFLDR
jgi:enoyl-CoA hydratase